MNIFSQVQGVKRAFHRMSKGHPATSYNDMICYTAVMQKPDTQNARDRPNPLDPPQ